MELIIIFKSRNQTLRCANFLRSAGYKSKIIDTPLYLYGSCTLSVLTDKAGFDYFYPSAHSFASFTGAYHLRDGKYTRIF
ncbi:MAG: DUF3343 domain-containing protein [Clostridia bacterium]|nr:DUF3343 domain-containing protein [Clostridia bacterium]